MARILLVDDDDQLRSIYRKMLEHESYIVEEAHNGKEALCIFRKDPADLVITDMVMPEKEGFETIKELKQEFPNVKIIAISGGGRIGPDIYLKCASQIGANYTFKKPVSREDLLNAVRTLLEE